MASNKRAPKASILNTEAFHFLRQKGASEKYLLGIKGRIEALPKRWLQQSQDETFAGRAKEMKGLASSVKALALKLNRNRFAKHLTLREIRDGADPKNDYEIHFMGSRQDNRPTVGDVLAHVADELFEQAGKPLSFEWQKKIRMDRYVFGGIASELIDTRLYRYKKTPNTHIAEIASIVLNKRVSVETIKKALQAF